MSVDSFNTSTILTAEGFLKLTSDRLPIAAMRGWDKKHLSEKHAMISAWTCAEKNLSVGTKGWCLVGFAAFIFATLLVNIYVGGSVEIGILQFVLTFAFGFWAAATLDLKANTFVNNEGSFGRALNELLAHLKISLEELASFDETAFHDCVLNALEKESEAIQAFEEKNGRADVEHQETFEDLFRLAVKFGVVEEEDQGNFIMTVSVAKQTKAAGAVFVRNQPEDTESGQKEPEKIIFTHREFDDVPEETSEEGYEADLFIRRSNHQLKPEDSDPSIPAFLKRQPAEEPAR